MNTRLDDSTGGSGPKTADAGRPREILALIAFVAICLGVSGAGGLITAGSVGTWYQDLEKPSFNPPDWVFAPVWTTLYVAMGIAAWRVWRRRTADGRIRALLVFAVQLLLTIVWSALFFGLHLIGLALAEIILLLFVISVNGALFWRLDHLAGALFIPYVLWVAYATVLNTALWRLN